MISLKMHITYRLQSKFLFCLLLVSFVIHAQEKTGDSITIAIAPQYDSVSSLHRFLLGESYRKLWAAPVTMRVIHLNTEKGGLKILQKGGGLQTKSLRLKDTSGKEWVLRSIQKYPERGLPENLRKTVAKDILQDQVVTGHPYSALTVPPLAAALGIPHANPEVVFLADDNDLGVYRSDFTNSVLLFEEREADDQFDTDNTEKTQEKLQDDNDRRVDQKLVLRARLLDLLIGDWDRHEDQWRWQKHKTKDGTVYAPVPKDRDKVYYNTSGLLPWFLSHQFLKSNLQGFHEKTRDIAGYNFNNRYFDRYFLTALSEDDWKEEVAYVQNTISDSLIRTAVRLLPNTIYNLSGENIINTLIARRNRMDIDVMEYYRFLSKNVDIPASDKHELFEIARKPDGKTEVTIHKIKKDRTKDRVIYHREFDPNVTKEVRLYGMAGNDVFSVTGSGDPRIKIRMIGGDDVDSFYIADDVANRRKLWVYDRSDQQNVLPAKKLAVLRTSKDSAVNEFNKRSFKYDQLGPAALIQYNLDQGFQFRAGMIYEKHGFRKEPYAARHEFFGNYSSIRKSFMFSYEADVKKAFGKSDLTVHILSRGPKNVSNFYGIGNETPFIRTDEKGISYYRNHYDYVNADVRLKRQVAKKLKVSAGVTAQYYSSFRDNNRPFFLDDYNKAQPEENVFSNRFYTGLAAGAEVNTRTDELMQHKGFYWNVDMRAMQEIKGNKKTYGQINSELSFYLPFLRDTNIVIANRIGGGTTVGEPAYFQQMQLGGMNNLRGFHSIRFTGKTMLYHNLELRLKLFNFNSYLFPGTVGLIGFNDVGRVWVPGETSKKWHDGYGGGLFIIPADLVLIQAVVGHSIEGTQPYISFGFRF